MTSKEKAKELVKIFSNRLTADQLNEIEDGLQCSLIAVELILDTCDLSLEDYWRGVEEELLKL